MDAVIAIVVLLLIIHVIAFVNHRAYWKYKLLNILLEMDEKDLISRERYLALLDEYDPNPFAFQLFSFSLFKGLPDEMDYPDLFTYDRYRKFEARHSRIRRYFIKLIILLFLVLFALTPFDSGCE